MPDPGPLANPALREQLFGGREQLHDALFRAPGLRRFVVGRFLAHAECGPVAAIAELEFE